MLFTVFVITSGIHIQEEDGSRLYVINQRTNKLFLHCWPVVAGRSQAENRRMGNGTGYCISVGVQELQIGRSLVRSQLVSLEFFIDIKSFRLHYGPGVDSASNRNEYQEYFLGVKAAGA